MHSEPLKTYLIEQLSNARREVRCIAPDADSECLHRFRVALRRFRSVLDAYTEHMYAPDAVAKSLIKVTNPLRETDVFLASIDADAYPNLYQAVAKYRTRQYRKIWNDSLVQRAEASLEKLVEDISKTKLTTSKKRMIETAEKLYKKARKKHHELTQDSPEPAIHKVRIAYKQARYVLEFLNAAGLIDAQKRIKKVKKTLDHFGAIQDAANQLEWLHRFCSEHPSNECSALYHERKNALKELKKAFKV
jgi:CHAD domain-containing protein